MADEQPAPYSRDFADVLEQELKAIQTRREAILAQELARANKKLMSADERTTASNPGDDPDSRLNQVRLKALDQHLAGICFSGGGIRSGTFAVGLLQGLANLGLLRRFDYLSTVSGGGYAGGWLASWLKRDGDVRNVEQQLSPSRVRQATAWREGLNPPPAVPYPPTAAPPRRLVVDEEPEPIHHLRSYSSYMAPQLGLLTADTWTIIAIWLRNVSVNLMMFLPMAMALVLLARLLLSIYAGLTTQAMAQASTQTTTLIRLGLGLLMLVVAFSFNGRALREFRRGGTPRFFNDEDTLAYWGWLYPLMFAGLMLSLSLRPVMWRINGLFTASPSAGAGGGPPAVPSFWGEIRDWLFRQVASDYGLLGAPNVVGHALVLGLGFVVGAIFLNLANRTLFLPYSWKFLRAAFFGGATGGVLLTVVEFATRALSDASHPELVAMLGTPAMLLVITSSIVVEVALVGRSINEAEREWWSRLAALLMIGGILWILAYATIIYVPILFIGAGLPIRILIASGWLTSTAAGIFAGRNAKPVNQGGSSLLLTIATVAPPLFLIGILGAISLLVAALVNHPGVTFPASGEEKLAIAQYFEGIRVDELSRISLWLGISIALAWIGSTLIDVNLFSLNAMYANRLIRCYLGASRPKKIWNKRWGTSPDPRFLSGAPIEATCPARDENPVTGFDPSDDIDLLDLRIGYVNPDKPEDRPYYGPHVLINTSLNLVGGTELAWRDRKGESFTLSPLYCGSKGTGYALVEPSSRVRLTLGRAMSISGAAVDPNMRFYQSSSLTAFLTLLNARLGYWMESPASPTARTGWAADSPKYSNLLWTEFFGLTVSSGEFVHLSDGGHFENMGVYELIRRRCRYIVACDAGEDTGPADENIAILIRLARIDFGVRIDLDATPFQLQGKDDLPEVHVVAGTIHYEDLDGGGMPGIILWVRISMTGDEPSDVQQYARTAPEFPHQPTDLKQSFTEEQFESYRVLGDHIANRVFSEPGENGEPSGKPLVPFWTETDPDREFAQGNARFFEKLKSRWDPARVAPTAPTGAGPEGPPPKPIL